MITKTGANLAYLDEKLWRGVKGLYSEFRNPVTRQKAVSTAVGASKSVLRPFYRGATAVGGAAEKAVDFTANAVVKHPGVALPALGAAAVAAYKFPRDLKVNLMHSDPNMDVTQRSGITGLRMRDGFSADQVGKNLYY